MNDPHKNESIIVEHFKVELWNEFFSRFIKKHFILSTPHLAPSLVAKDDIRAQ